MELQGTILSVGAILEKGASNFKVAKIMLDRKSSYQGKEYPNFTEVTFQGNKTDILEKTNVAPGDYVKVNGDLQGRYFDYQGEQKFAQDFVAWSLETIRKVEPQTSTPATETKNGSCE